MSAPSVPETDLIQRLACLETRLVTLQEQLTGLVLTLLQERERTVEHRIAALESLLQPLMGGHLLTDPQEQGARQAPADVSPRVHQPLPVEHRARSRLPALIEYGAQGVYVIVSSLEGELQLAPDSAQWVAWLASISSFRFVGKQGRFTAYRDTKHGHPTRSWRAYRTIHQHNYKHSLAVTEQLTIIQLEQVAALLQAHVGPLSLAEPFHVQVFLWFHTSAAVVRSPHPEANTFLASKETMSYCTNTLIQMHRLRYGSLVAALP
jgi:hypothetical protein